MVLAPEHPLVDRITTPEQKAAVDEYRTKASLKSDLDRTDLAKDKTGVFTGGYAINPVNGEKVPVWIADYVLISYGTGAIMAVPAHDERDYEFAKAFGIRSSRLLHRLRAADTLRISTIRPSRRLESQSIPVSMTVLRRLISNLKFQRTWPPQVLAKKRSTIVCETGCSAVSDIGASRFRSGMNWMPMAIRRA
jgi:hypothetical protein